MCHLLSLSSYIVIFYLSLSSFDLLSGNSFDFYLVKDGNFCSCLINDLLKEEKESK